MSDLLASILAKALVAAVEALLTRLLVQFVQTARQRRNPAGNVMPALA
ncbi:hypothetical protein AB0C21_05050 [Spirillospora sp. NPDC049024]